LTAISYSRSANSCNLLCHSHAHPGGQSQATPAKSAVKKRR
jgi:hypothetical protein